jgi:MoaA/NifB/PqqE/SkfB family radical SAM enzyme
MANKNYILTQVQQKAIFIWGARMTGLGALRFLRSNGINPVSFIDSDPAFEKKFVGGLPVIHPNQLSLELDKHESSLILVAVSLKEDEILLQLKERGINETPVISFQDEDSPYYTIDILSSCNLKCASCPHSIPDHGVPGGSMDLNTFKKVFDKVKTETPSISHISLYSWGEPLLHPYIKEIVQYIHDSNVAVALSSNLSIKFDSRIEDLVISSPDYLKISVSGYYPDAYNKTHEGGDINLVKSNLYKLRYLMDKHNSKILVDINYHMYRDNSGKNLKKFEELADELGFALSKTYALVMPLERVIAHCDGVPDKQTRDLHENLLVSIDEGIEASSERRLPKNSCPFRENQININADLTVPVCCTVFQRGANVVAANYLESSLKEINFNKSKSVVCTKCMALGLPEYNMGFNKEGWTKFANQKTITDVGQ